MTVDEAIKTFVSLHDKAKGYDYVRSPVSWALYHTWKESEKEEVYERCVICGKMTKAKKTDQVRKRRYYVIGAGQLCKECWERIYHDSES